MKEYYNENKSKIDKYLFIIIFLLFIYLFVKYLFGYIAPFFVAFVISMIINPVVDFLNKKLKINRNILTIVSIAAILTGFWFLGTNIVGRIIFQAQAFIDDFPRLLSEIQLIIENLIDKINSIFSLIPENFQQDVNNLLMELVTVLTTSITSFIGSIFKNNSLSIFSKIPGIIMAIVLTLVSLFFFISDKNIIHESIRKASPDWLKDRVVIIRSGVFSAIGGYIKAQLIIMSIISAICIISLSFLKYEYALLVGLIIALVDALPIFGSGFILWPWILLSLITSDFRMAVGLLITYGVVFISRQTLEPKVLGKQIGVHPLLTLMSIYVGLKVFGGLGFLLGPFVVITIKAILESELGETPKEKLDDEDEPPVEEALPIENEDVTDEDKED